MVTFLSRTQCEAAEDAAALAEFEPDQAGFGPAPIPGQPYGSSNTLKGWSAVFPDLARRMAVMAAGLASISICSKRAAMRVRGTTKATTSPFRVMAEVFVFRQRAGNRACPCVTVNVSFMVKSI